MENDLYPVTIAGDCYRDNGLFILDVWIRRYISDNFDVRYNGDDDLFEIISTDNLILSQIEILVEQVLEHGHPKRPYWIGQV